MFEWKSLHGVPSSWFTEIEKSLMLHKHFFMFLCSINFSDNMTLFLEYFVIWTIVVETKLVLCSNFIIINSFIGKSGIKKKKRSTERKLFHYLVHSPSKHKDLSWANLILGSKNSLQVPWRCRVPRHWTILECFSRRKQGAGMEM